jgi:hypothetical protein
MNNHLERILEDALSTDVPLNLTEIINKFDDAVIETGDSETVPYYKDGHYHITVPKNETPETRVNVAFQLAYVIEYGKYLASENPSKVTFANIVCDPHCFDIALAILMPKNLYLKTAQELANDEGLIDATKLADKLQVPIPYAMTRNKHISSVTINRKDF